MSDFSQDALGALSGVNTCQDSGDFAQGEPVQRQKAEFGHLDTKVWEPTEGNFDGDCKWCQT